jgi:hypothetical protein
MTNHDPLCPSMDESESEYCSLCHCHLITKVREDMRQPGRIQFLIDEAYKRGYKEAEEFYTNSCMLCGYAGEWSTYICDECIEENKNVL